MPTTQPPEAALRAEFCDRLREIYAHEPHRERETTDTAIANLQAWYLDKLADLAPNDARADVLRLTAEFARQRLAAVKLPSSETLAACGVRLNRR